MEHRLWNTLKAKKQEGSKRIFPFLKPRKEPARARFPREERGMSFHGKCDQHASGLKTGPVLVEKIPHQKKDNRPLRGKNADIHVHTRLQVGGTGYSSKLVQEEDIVEKSTYSKHDTKLSDPTSIQSALKQPKVPSLPRIPPTQRTRTKSLREKNADNTAQLTKHLNLIDGRQRTSSFRNNSKDSSNVGWPGDKITKSLSSTVLQTELSLPKITIDEVLKSWDIHSSVPIRKRSAGSRTLKHDPMEFLMRQELSRQETSHPCYDKLKTCRYLRMGKEMEETATRGRCCPCNSCEHGQGLKESPYLNA